MRAAAKSASRAAARRPARRVEKPRWAGDPAIAKGFEHDYRFWARVPSRVNAILFLADPHDDAAPDGKMLAVVGRPDFPAGVCTGCGCQEHDACVVGFDVMSDDLIGCSWIDTTRTRCSKCGPVPAAVAPAKRKGVQ